MYGDQTSEFECDGCHRVHVNIRFGLCAECEEVMGVSSAWWAADTHEAIMMDQYFNPDL